MSIESPAAYSPNIASLLGALQAVKNVRAVALTALVLVTTALVFAVVMFAAGRTGSMALTVIGVLFAYLVAIYGVSAVGFMVMNDVKGAPPLSISDALSVSLISTHRWIAVMLLALVVFVVFSVVLVILLFICKIPFLGPVLYAVVVPVATFATALFLAAMYFVVMPLSFPSVWMGDGIMQVVSKLAAIARQRLVPVVVQVVLLMLLCFFVAGLIASLVFSAAAIVGSMSAAILPGVGGGIGAFSGMGRMMGGMSGAGGYLIGGGVGFAIVVAVVMIVPFLIMIRGYCLIYLNAIQGVDFSSLENVVKSQVEHLQRSAREAQERVREKGQVPSAPPPTAAPAPRPAPPPAAAPVRPAAPPPPPAAPPIQSAPPATAAPVTAPATQCPKCNGPIASDDAFCGGCGHKLR